MSSAREIQAILAAAGAEPAALATLITVSGSSYRQVGARCLVLSSGRAIGSISGGCLEEDVRQRAARVLATGEPQVAVYDTAQENDLVWGTGLGCQGEVRVFFERLPSPKPVWMERLGENFVHRRDTHLRIVYGANDARALGTRLSEGDSPVGDLQFVEERIAAPPSIVIFGAGDDAMPLVEFAARLGWHVVVLDSRAAYATRERFPQAHEVGILDADAAAAHPAIDDRSYVVVMSHRYRSDLAFLQALAARSIAYLGVLGPRQRTQRMLDDLASEGAVLSRHLQQRLYAPVGLDLGGASPETVALSIIAELQAIQSGRMPQHLRDSQKPIHG
jgi:xanthine/CO dehydrogenase XdhC/CoxF family maturation factor